jgi:hypothetical protein
MGRPPLKEIRPVSTRLFDRAGFWSAVAAVLVALGGVGLLLGTVNLAAHQGNREPWFGIGIALVTLAVVALLWAIILFLAHRYAESHPVTAPAEAPRGVTPAPPPGPLERLRELRRETAELRVVIDEAQGHRMHAEARQQINAWALRVEAELQSQDEELWKMFRPESDPPPGLLDRSAPHPAEMTDEHWERNIDMQDSNSLRSFLRRKEEALGRAISRLLG